MISWIARRPVGRTIVRKFQASGDQRSGFCGVRSDWRSLGKDYDFAHCVVYGDSSTPWNSPSFSLRAADQFSWEYRGEQVGGSADSFCERIKHRIEARRIRIGSGQRPRCGCYDIAVQVPDELDYVLHCLRKCQSTSAGTSPGRALACRGISSSTAMCGHGAGIGGSTRFVIMPCRG
jgi:hypothetical protein